MLAVNTTGSVNVRDNNTVEGYELYNNKVKVFFYIKTEQKFINEFSLGCGQ